MIEFKILSNSRFVDLSFIPVVCNDLKIKLLKKKLLLIKIHNLILRGFDQVHTGKQGARKFWVWFGV